MSTITVTDATFIKSYLDILRKQVINIHNLTSLLESMTNPNIVDGNKNSILHILAKKNTYVPHTVFKMILNTKVDVNLKNVHNYTALEILIGREFCTGTNTDIMNIIIDILESTTYVPHIVFTKLIDKKCYDIVNRIMCMNMKSTIKSYPRDKSEAIFKNMIDEVFVAIGEKNQNNFDKCLLMVENFIIIQKYDNNSSILFGNGFDIYNFIAIKTKNSNYKSCMVSSLILMLFKYFIIHVSKKIYDYLVSLSFTNCCSFDNSHLSESDDILRDEKCRNVLEKIRTFVMQHSERILTEPQMNNTVNILMHHINNQSFLYVNDCFRIIMEKYDVINKHEVNIVNAVDGNGNNIMHYYFAKCKCYKEPIHIKFYQFISRSSYSYIIDEPNKNNYTPFNVYMYTNYISFGKMFVDAFDIIGSFTHKNKESLIHSLIMSSANYHSEGYEVNYEVMQERNIVNDKLKVVKTHKMYKKSFLNMIMGNNSAENTMKLSVNCLVSSDFDQEIKPHIYKNVASDAKCWIKDVCIPEVEKFNIVCKFFKENPSYIDKTDYQSRTCFLLSVMINAEYYADFFIKNGASILKKDVYGNSAFHYIAYNGNYVILSHIQTKMENMKDWKKVLAVCFNEENSEEKTPMDICIEEQNFKILEMMLNVFDTIRDTLAKRLIEKICFSPQYEDTHMYMIEKIMSKTQYAIHTTKLYNSSVCICNIMHYCAYNNFNILLKYLILNCLQYHHHDMLHDIDSNEMSILTIAIKMNNMCIIDMFCQYGIYANDHELIYVHNNIPCDESLAIAIYEKLIKYDIVDINKSIEGMSLLHRICLRGDMHLINYAVDKNNISKFSTS